jgi:hypothetical protein
MAGALDITTDIIGAFIAPVGLALLATAYVRSLDSTELRREYPRLMRIAWRWTAMLMIASILGWLTAETSAGPWWFQLLWLTGSPFLFFTAFRLLIAPDFDLNWRHVDARRVMERIGLKAGVLLLIGIVLLLIATLGSLASR